MDGVPGTTLAHDNGSIFMFILIFDGTEFKHRSMVEAAIIGNKHPDGPAKPRSFVNLREGGQHLGSLATENGALSKAEVGEFEHPGWIEFIDELPKKATCKIQLFKMHAID